ncbi:MAG: RNA polymerase subunit sigma-70 [Niameybacter sp.]
MTQEQKEKIKELRLEGLGYKEIATVVGLSRDGVRSFCKWHELSGHGCVVALNIAEKKQKNMLCLQCEKPLKHRSRGRTRKFCSDLCRRSWWVQHQEAANKKEKSIYNYTCLWCAQSFKAYGNRHRKYCSHSCYVKHRYEEGNDGV